MIKYLKGKIVDKNQDQIVIAECNNIGYEIIADNDLYNTVSDENIIIYVIMIPGEDEFRLYGFLKKSKRSLFRMLRSVSGLGSKSAMKIISAANTEELTEAIITGNVDFLKSLPGIGKKTAERLILELKSKISEIAPSTGETVSDTKNMDIELFTNTLEGLTALGYPESTSRKLLRDILKENQDWTVETLIKAALKRFL